MGTFEQDPSLNTSSMLESILNLYYIHTYMYMYDVHMYLVNVGVGEERGEVQSSEMWRSLLPLSSQL